MMVEAEILIVIGFFLLIKGADYLVDGAVGIAKKFNIPEIVIGLTIVSIGTSMPELIVSITSAFEGFSDMAIGNVVGSNVANLLLILGVASILSPVLLKKETRLIEVPLCLAVSIIFYFICNIGQDVTRADGIILISLFVLFIVYTIVMAFKGNEFDKEDGVKEVKETKKSKKEKESINVLKSIFHIVLGIGALKFGGDLAVNNAVKIAEWFGLSEKIISVTILAIGTSLPELVTTVSAAIKKESDIAIGNILGSNIFNMLLIIGVSALIKPITYNLSYNTDMYIAMIAAFVLFLFAYIPPKNQMSRANGIVYLLLYIIYMVTLFV